MVVEPGGRGAEVLELRAPGGDAGGCVPGDAVPVREDELGAAEAGGVPRGGNREGRDRPRV